MTLAILSCFCAIIGLEFLVSWVLLCWDFWPRSPAPPGTPVAKQRQPDVQLGTWRLVGNWLRFLAGIAYLAFVETSAIFGAVWLLGWNCQRLQEPLDCFLIALVLNCAAIACALFVFSHAVFDCLVALNREFFSRIDLKTLAKKQEDLS
jgi:hypothetical protein